MDEMRNENLKFEMLEGEYFVDMWVDMDYLYVKSNLDRVWKSTNTSINNIDFVEITFEN